MLSLVFAVSAGIFALGAAFAAPAYKDTAVTRHPFGEAAGMYMDLTTYGDMKTDGTYPIGGTFPTDIGATSVKPQKRSSASMKIVYALPDATL